MAQPLILISHDAEQMSQEAANQLTQLAQQQVRTSGRFSAALAGGSTPKRLYELLASEPYRSRIPWQSVYLFWGDERCVPPDHPESNFRMAHEALLSSVPIPQTNIHRILVDWADPEHAASLYEQTLREFFRLSAGAWPEFDLMLLGLGEEGHIASLFPHSPALRESHRFAVATTGGRPNLPRVTLTLPVFNRARNLLWLVAGPGKASIVRAVLERGDRPEEVPAGRVTSASGATFWFLDRAAASLLRKDQVRAGGSA